MEKKTIKKFCYKKTRCQISLNSYVRSDVFIQEKVKKRKCFTKIRKYLLNVYDMRDVRQDGKKRFIYNCIKLYNIYNYIYLLTFYI